jgi:hypothetical protein
METKTKKPIQHYMRALHRDIGFLVIGLTIVYGLSGIVLMYRDTDFLKSEQQIEQQLEPNINESDLGKALRMRNFEVVKTEGDVVYFQSGTYNKSTGLAQYKTKQLPVWLDKFNKFHKTASKNLVHWAGIVYAALLLFLAISSFWMFKPKSKMFARGLAFAGIGLILAIVVLLL